MAAAKNGDTVKVHYTGKLADGVVFDSSDGKKPLEFELGAQQVIPGFENGVIGMAPGEEKQIEIPVAQAYGQRKDDLVWTVDREALPAELEPEVGMQLQSVQEDGRRIEMTITELSDEKVTLDANHPLSGQDLMFEVKLMEIVG